MLTRETWLAALRSGEYEQTTGALRRIMHVQRDNNGGVVRDEYDDIVLDDGDGYCCWGVACDLYDTTAWEDDGAGVIRTSKPMKIQFGRTTPCPRHTFSRQSASVLLRRPTLPS